MRKRKQASVVGRWEPVPNQTRSDGPRRRLPSGRRISRVWDGNQGGSWRRAATGGDGAGGWAGRSPGCDSQGRCAHLSGDSVTFLQGRLPAAAIHGEDACRHHRTLGTPIPFIHAIRARLRLPRGRCKAAIPYQRRCGQLFRLRRRFPPWCY